jgi:prepilin-type N-terminal cleavage/methylation domain-containing protein
VDGAHLGFCSDGPTPGPSKEGSVQIINKFPSLEGLGVGSQIALGSAPFERGSEGVKRDRFIAAARGGFTLLEIMLALAILTAVTAVTYLTFSTGVTAWKKGQALSDEIQHADFVMEQLVSGLRSAYFVDGPTTGFRLEDDGDDEHSSDKISWVKLGGALVGKNCPFAGSAHRVEFSVEKDAEDKDAVMVKAWRLHGQPDDFDPEELEPVPICRGIIGFNCRPQDPENRDEVEWLDEWDDTNRIPLAVEVTLYMEPLSKGEEPVEVKRIVSIPVAPLSWGRAATPVGAVTRGPGGTFMRGPGGTVIPQPGGGGARGPGGAFRGVPGGAGWRGAGGGGGGGSGRTAAPGMSPVTERSIRRGLPAESSGEPGAIAPPPLPGQTSGGGS